MKVVLIVLGVLVLLSALVLYACVVVGRNRRSGATEVTDEGTFVKMAKLVINYCEKV